MTDPGDQVVHIGENAEIVDQSKRGVVGLLSVDEPVEAHAQPIHSTALQDAVDLMTTDTWRPAIVTAPNYRGTGDDHRVLGLVDADDPEKMIFICPVLRPQDKQEQTA